MSKIIKNFEDVSYSISTGFSKELGLFTVKGTVWSNAIHNELKGTYEHEISDIEMSYEINGKYCRYEGFKELYEKLYGINSFSQFEEDITKDFEKTYHERTPYKNK